MTPTRFLVGQILVVFAIVIGGLWLSTEWVATALGYQPRLGLPWFEALSLPVYYPWRLFEWWYAFDAYEPTVFNKSGIMAASSGVAGIVVAVIGSLWRARQSRLATTYGSSRRASRPELEAAGLFRPAGVFLGRLKDRYLRHDGPEHVMAFAPTRSGKGVGLVIPTLLSWTGSAVVHDIKGENWQLTAGWRARFSHCLLFNPTDPRSARYNPLLEVRKGPNEVRDVQNIADILVDPEGALERRSHWEKTSHSLLVGVILHVLYAEPEKTLSRVATFLSDPRRSFEHTLRHMMETNHLGTADHPIVHPVVASAAREVLNKSDNERSGVLSTAMSCLGICRDPVVAVTTASCDSRIADLVDAELPASLYLVIPPSDISRTNPKPRRRPGQAAPSSPPNDARRVPGPGTARILRDGTRLQGWLRHARLSHRPFPEPDFQGLWREQRHPRQLPCSDRVLRERRAHGKAHLECARDGNGTAVAAELCWTPCRARKRPAHCSRPLLTSGGVMQLPSAEELILVSGLALIRAQKLRYYEDRNQPATR